MASNKQCRITHLFEGFLCLQKEGKMGNIFNEKCGKKNEKSKRFLRLDFRFYGLKYLTKRNLFSLSKGTARGKVGAARRDVTWKCNSHLIFHWLLAIELAPDNCFASLGGGGGGRRKLEGIHYICVRRFGSSRATRPPQARPKLPGSLISSPRFSLLVASIAERKLKHLSLNHEPPIIFFINFLASLASCGKSFASNLISPAELISNIERKESFQ